MIAEEDRDQTRIRADYLDILYKRHVQGGFVRSIASFFMWCSSWIAYVFDIIRLDNFTGVSLGVLFLILFNLPTLWILKRIKNKKLFEYFSLLINLLEIIGYTAVMHFLGGNRGTLPPARLWRPHPLCRHGGAPQISLHHRRFLHHQLQRHGDIRTLRHTSVL